MKKMKRYEDGGDVDYDKDSDSEAQKVYRADLTELSDEERMPKRSASAKKAAPKRGTKGHKDYFNELDPDMSVKGVRDEGEAYFGRGRLRNAPARSTTGKMPGMEGGAYFGRAKRKQEDAFKSGGSVKSSASRRADGIAQRGKTRGKLV